MIAMLICSALTFTFGEKSVAFDPVGLTTRAGLKAAVRIERVADDVCRVHVTGSEACLDEVRLAAQGKLKALWYGNGHYVLRPGRISLESNGHGNATSFDGFDFENGVSVLMASEEPIRELFHDPAAGRCGITASDPTVFTVIAGTNGAAACALRYRRLYPRKPAPGVAVKAGKMCLDFWRGTLKYQTSLLKRLKAAGIGDDFFVLTHNWQRFGYDCGLPDVFPPNPKIGTVADLQAFLKVAKDAGWYAGVHLNTIDMYPKAPSWNKDWICRDEKGEMIPAWYNAFAEDQSYRVLPERQVDSIRLQLKSINDGGCACPAIFVDVNGSHHPGATVPYWDAQGRRHTRHACVKHFGAIFDTIREMQDAATGTRTFTNSEGCHDFLAGHLDGGDCQWLEPAHERGEYIWYPLGDYEALVKVPWFDLVNHRAISVHGAGYSIRYESGRGALFHGIDSDDYLSAEVLAGHPLMVDCYSRDVKGVTREYLDPDRCVRQVVRHYRLAQRTVAELADAEIEDFSFADGNIYHQHVRWSNGTDVWVNRGKDEWTVRPGVVLPRYGYFATNRVTGTTSAIRRANGRVIEESAHVKDGRLVRYRDNRDRPKPDYLPLVTTATASVGAGRIRGRVSVENFRGAAFDRKPVTATLWLVRRKPTENSRTLPDYRLGDFSRALGESFDFDLPLPPKVDGVYDLLVSFVPAGVEPTDEVKRLKTLGTDSFSLRYHLGRVFVETNRFEPYVQPDRDLYDRAFPVVAVGRSKM